MANTNLTDYGKLAYTKVQELEKQLADLQAQTTDTVAGQMVVPQMKLANGGARHARILAKKDCGFDVRLEAYCYSLVKTNLTATLYVDDEVADEIQVVVDAVGQTFTFLLSARYVRRGEHDVKVRLFAEHSSTIASGIVIDFIGADVAVLLSAGKLDLAVMGEKDVGLLLENGVARVFTVQNGEIEFSNLNFSHVKDACLCVHTKSGQTQIAVLTVTRGGRAFVHRFRQDFKQTGFSFMGVGWSTASATTVGDTMQVVFLKNGRFHRAVYDFLQGAGASAKRRESEWVSQQVSLTTDGSHMLLASQNQGTIRIFQTPPQMETERDTLAFSMRIQEEYTNA